MAVEKHCRTCMCWNVTEEALHLPDNYLPNGWYVEVINGHRFVCNPNGAFDYYWTRKLQMETEGYAKIMFDIQQGATE